MHASPTLELALPVACRLDLMPQALYGPLHRGPEWSGRSTPLDWPCSLALAKLNLAHRLVQRPSSSLLVPMCLSPPGLNIPTRGQELGSIIGCVQLARSVVQAVFHALAGQECTETPGNLLTPLLNHVCKSTPHPPNMGTKEHSDQHRRLSLLGLKASMLISILETKNLRHRGQKRLVQTHILNM